MRVTAELSLYPLNDAYLSAIEAYIAGLQSRPGLDVVVNQMSTQIAGEISDVFAAVEALTRDSFERGGPQVLVAKLLNADLPVSEPPEIGRGDRRGN